MEGTKCSVVMPLPGDQPYQIRAVLMTARLRYNQSGPGHERPEEFPDGDVEAEGGFLKHPIAGD